MPGQPRPRWAHVTCHQAIGEPNLKKKWSYWIMFKVRLLTNNFEMDQTIQSIHLTFKNK